MFGGNPWFGTYKIGEVWWYAYKFQRITVRNNPQKWGFLKGKDRPKAPSLWRLF